MQKELKFQKDVVFSAVKFNMLAEITTHKFKKGWPDVLIKDRPHPTLHIECKYELKRVTMDTVPIEFTELQKYCLKRMQEFGMMAMGLVCVEIDKRDVRCYPVYDIDKERVNITEDLCYSPIDRQKGRLIWPVREIIVHAIRCLKE